MTFRHLEIFAEVCQQLNMSKAAENLSVSQSSVSQAISSLENEFNVVLFQRVNHTLVLTNAGRKMLFLTRQVLDSVDQLKIHMNSDGQDTMRLGAGTTIGSCLLNPLIDFYRSSDERNSEVYFDVAINNSSILQEQLLNDQLDMAIIQVTNLSDYLEYVSILKDELTIVCHSDHPLAGSSVSLSQLAHENFVVREEGSKTEFLLEQAFDLHGLPLNKHWMCNNPEATKQAVANGRGLALLSRFVVSRELADGSLKEIHIKDHHFHRDFALAWQRSKAGDPNLQQFASFCRALGDPGMQKIINENM